MIEFRKTEQIETVFRSLPVFVQQHSRMVGQYAKLLIENISFAFCSPRHAVRRMCIGEGERIIPHPGNLIGPDFFLRQPVGRDGYGV